VGWGPDVASFLDEKRFAVLATLNEDGSIQQTVMWYERDGDGIVMNTRKGRRKYHNLARTGWASLCVEEGERYVTVTGPVTIDEDRQRGQDGMRRMTTRYEGEAEADRRMREEYAQQHRVVLRMTPESIDIHGFGG
jgi:PPOX class probable F420-dependent enzyme